MPLFFADAAGAAVGGLFLFFLILGLLYAVLWLYCLINAATRPDLDGTQRIIWILVLLFLHGVGPFLYLIFARRNVL